MVLGWLGYLQGICDIGSVRIAARYWWYGLVRISVGAPKPKPKSEIANLNLNLNPKLNPNPNPNPNPSPNPNWTCGAEIANRVLRGLCLWLTCKDQGSGPGSTGLGLRVRVRVRVTARGIVR